MLLFIDGFDHYATADLGKKGWTATGTDPTNLVVSASAGRRGGGALALGGGGNINDVMGGRGIAQLATVVIGFAHQASAAGTTLCALHDATSSTRQVTLKHNTDGTITAYRGSSVLGTALGTSTLTMTAGGFNFVECKATIHPSAGSVEVRVNGVTFMSLTGQNTRSSSNSYANAIRLGWDTNPPAGTTAVFDDLYVCDTSGSVNYDFLGDCRVDTVYPVADGFYGAFTPSTGTSHYALVDEAPPNTTDYVDGAAVGDRDSYDCGALSALLSETVFGVQVNAAALKDDSGTRSLATMARSGSTNSDGSTVALATSQGILSQVFESDPASAGAWTESAVNSAEFGVKVAA